MIEPEFDQLYRKGIRTYTGKFVDLLNPTEDMIDVEDIAHALSEEGRWGNHTKVKYSVGQHSMAVCDSVEEEEEKIAALFHDYNHTSKTSDDGLNINLAIEGIKKHILPVDEPFIGEIASYIIGTQFPPVVDLKDLSLPASIVRDADVAYTLANVWIQTVNFGLNVEIGITTKQILKMQEPFLRNLKFMTEWANKEYNGKIEDRIKEANDMYSVLYNE